MRMLVDCLQLGLFKNQFLHANINQIQISSIPLPRKPPLVPCRPPFLCVANLRCLSQNSLFDPFVGQQYIAWQLSCVANGYINGKTIFWIVRCKSILVQVFPHKTNRQLPPTRQLLHATSQRRRRRLKLRWSRLSCALRACGQSNKGAPNNRHFQQANWDLEQFFHEMLRLDGFMDRTSYLRVPICR